MTIQYIDSLVSKAYREEVGPMAPDTEDRLAILSRIHRSTAARDLFKTRTGYAIDGLDDLRLVAIQLGEDPHGFDETLCSSEFSKWAERRGAMDID
ncbi:MAG: hypothetical protein ABH879_06410 [archaeon]